MDVSGETQMVMLRIVTVLAETMTNEQRRAAAEKLRALDADEIERRFLASVATALDDYAATADE